MRETYGEYQAQYEDFVDLKYEYRYFIQMGSNIRMSDLDGSMKIIEIEDPRRIVPIIFPWGYIDE